MMKTYTFPYGTGEWDGTIDVELTDEEAAILDSSMADEEYFHLDEVPGLKELDQRITKIIFEEAKQQCIKDGRIEELREFNPEADDNELVWDELGNFHICMPNAFDWMKGK